MQSLPQEQNQDNFASTDSSFQRKSLATTQIQTVYDRPQNKLRLSDNGSIPTSHELPYNSRAFDFDDKILNSTEQQLVQVTKRFEGVLRLLRGHSQMESENWQRAMGFRVLPIQVERLRPDYTNKINIIGDIVDIVDELERNCNDKVGELLDFKFQEYYLQRHYGGISEVAQLGLDQKEEDEQLLENDEQQGVEANQEDAQTDIQRNSQHSSAKIDQQHNQEESVVSQDNNSEIQAYIISRIGNTQSLLNTAVNCLSIQTQTLPAIPLQVPYLIEVPIPLIVGKVQIQESVIENIINHYSKPYEDFYQSESPGFVGTHSTLKSGFQLFNQPKDTEVELVYSQLPGDTGFKLPLDSYAQIQSLISHDSNSRPATDRSIPCTNEAYFTQNVQNSNSLLERYQQNERLLNLQNTELKQKIGGLLFRVQELQNLNRGLQNQKDKLLKRLEEEIQQSEYCTNKLEEMDIQMMEEQLQALKNLSQTQERRMENMNMDLAKKIQIIERMALQIQQSSQTLKCKEELLTEHQEAIQQLQQALLEKQQEIMDLNNCEQSVQRFASTKQLSLKKEISQLQQEKSQLKEKVSTYHKMLQSEGISLQYEQAAQLQSIIEAKEHTHRVQLADVDKKYKQMVGLYKEQLSTLNKQLQELSDMNQSNRQLIAQQQKKASQQTKQQQQNARQFQAIVEEYDQQLATKDEEIQQLKKKQHMFLEGQEGLLLGPWHRAVQLLEKQLESERLQKNKMTSRILEIERYMHQEIQVRNKEMDKQSTIIEELTQQLQQQMDQNQQLRQMLAQQAKEHELVNKQSNLIDVKAAEELKHFHLKVQKVNGKLKRYTKALQQQLRAVCAIDCCQTQKNWLQRVIQERDFYLELVAR